MPTASPTVHRRTVVLRGPANQLANVLRTTNNAGKLLTPPHNIQKRRCEDAPGIWEIRYDVAAPPPSPLLTAARYLAGATLTLAALFALGYATWLLFADEIGAALWLLTKTATVAAAATYGASTVRRLLHQRRRGN